MAQTLSKRTAVKNEAQNGLTLPWIISLASLASALSSLMFAAFGETGKHAVQSRGRRDSLGAWTTRFILARYPCHVRCFGHRSGRICESGRRDANYEGAGLGGGSWCCFVRCLARLSFSLKKLEFQFGLRSLLALVAGVAILTVAWPVIDGVFSEIEEYPSDLLARSRQWNGIDAEVYRAAMQGTGIWLWAATHFVVHAGPFTGVAASLLIVAIWSARRSARHGGSTFVGYCTTDVRHHVASTLTCITWSALVVGTCWLPVYVWTIPELVRTNGACFQEQMHYCRDPQSDSR